MGGNRRYLDFDELFEAVDDSKVLVSLGGLRDYNLITSFEPATIFVPDECFGCGFFVVEIAQRDRGGLHKQFAWLAVFGDLPAVLVDDLGSHARN